MSANQSFTPIKLFSLLIQTEPRCSTSLRLCVFRRRAVFALLWTIKAKTLMKNGIPRAAPGWRTLYVYECARLCLPVREDCSRWIEGGFYPRADIETAMGTTFSFQNWFKSDQMLLQPEQKKQSESSVFRHFETEAWMSQKVFRRLQPRGKNARNV